MNVYWKSLQKTSPNYRCNLWLSATFVTYDYHTEKITDYRLPMWFTITDYVLDVLCTTTVLHYRVCVYRLPFLITECYDYRLPMTDYRCDYRLPMTDYRCDYRLPITVAITDDRLPITVWITDRNGLPITDYRYDYRRESILVVPAWGRGDTPNVS